MATDPPEYLPYFDAQESLLISLATVYDVVGKDIAARRYYYQRGAFYEQAALAIQTLLDLQFQPFMAANHNWEWWAQEMREHAIKLGDDPDYAMILPSPFQGEWHDYPILSNRFDELVALTTGTYRSEDEDSDVGGRGTITRAECVKLTHRF